MLLKDLLCPTCKTLFGIMAPDNIAEAYGEGMAAGFDQALCSMEMAGINISSFKKETGRIRTIAGDISEFLNEPVDIVQLKMFEPEVRLANAWSKRNGDTEGFYKNNLDYLYDNSKYNSFPRYQMQRLLPFVNIKKRTTLDIGCGIGTLVFMLAGQNNDAWGYDINDLIIQFARFRAAKYKINARFTTEKPDYSKFDLITALGTLEHFENLQEFLRELGTGMKSEALFFHYDDWGQQNVSPMHFDHSRGINTYLNDSGFKIISEQWAIKK